MDSPSAAPPPALSGRRVALLGGFLLLGAFAFALWLLFGASPASAQSDDANTTPDSSTTRPADAQQAAPPDSPAPSDDSNALQLPPLPIDVSALVEQTLPPVTEALPP